MCTGRSHGNQSVRDTIICDGDVGKDFANGADPLARSPAVLFGRHGFCQARISLFVIGDLFKEFRTGACVWCVWAKAYHLYLAFRLSLSPAGGYKVQR